MKPLRNHPGLSLQDDAADALTRLEAAHGVQPITSAYRSPATQQALINRWRIGGRLNRPPYLFEPASIKASKHISGLAIDTSNPGNMHKWGPSFGFFFNYAYDKVHFEYDRNRDPSRVAAPKPSGGMISDPGVANQQDFLIRARGEKIVKDGKRGPATIAAFKRYQQFLRRYGYTGVIDGVWGTGTQRAHEKYFAEWKRTH